ncbi:MAG: cache domain-containing protein [Spirochaetes bacterium]|nr:cache domain-containing protein [Spirochaetota bacterium]
MRIKDMKLSTKSAVIIVFVVLCFVAVIGWISLRMSESLSETRYATAKAATEVGRGILEYYAGEAKAGRMTLEEAQNAAKEAVKALRYEGSEYYWINDTALPYPTMIMHSTNPALNGKVMDSPSYNVAMGKNQNLFQAFVEVCKKEGGGFVDYLWSKPGEPQHLVFPKISYVMLFPEWDWIIGTGVYIDNVQVMLKAVLVPIIIISIVMIGIIVLALVVLVRAILKSIRILMNQASRLAQGDFTERVEIKQKDEVGILTSTLNGSMDNLERLISEVMVSTQNLSQAVQEIANGNENLSQRTSEQASSLEEVASTIEEATASIKQNVENSILANKQAIESSRMAEEGGRVVAEAVAAINEVSLYSKKIGDIISVINEIAFQTNLLALNAAVEAARAGEQGRGFAVVAGEVRNLAQRAGSSAKEIGQLINDSVDKVAVGTELANKSGEALKEIIQSVKSVGQMVAEISAASEEQKRGVDQINIAIAELDTMTQQNAALVEETASASEEMSNQSQELQVMVGKFKIRDDVRGDVFSQKRKDIHLSTEQIVRGRDGKGNGDGKGATAAAIHDAKSKDIKDLLTKEGFEEF